MCLRVVKKQTDSTSATTEQTGAGQQKKFCIRAIFVFIVKTSGDPRSSVREIGAPGETLKNTPFGYFLLLCLVNERAKRSPSALATRSAPKASHPHPSPRPRLRPLCRTRPPVAALAPRAESQSAARVRSNSPEHRLAGKPRRSAPAKPQGGRGPRSASQSQAPFVFSLTLRISKVDSRQHPPRPRSVRARWRPAHTGRC